MVWTVYTSSGVDQVCFCVSVAGAKLAGEVDGREMRGIAEHFCAGENSGSVSLRSFSDPSKLTAQRSSVLDLTTVFIMQQPYYTCTVTVPATKHQSTCFKSYGGIIIFNCAYSKGQAIT